MEVLIFLVCTLLAYCFLHRICETIENIKMSREDSEEYKIISKLAEENSKLVDLVIKAYTYNTGTIEDYEKVLDRIDKGE